VFSSIVANFGVSTIIKFSAPILSVIYPPTVTLVILTLFKEKIKNNYVFIFSTYTALFISVLTVLNNMGIGSSIGVPIVTELPFANLGFNWIVPVIVAGIMGILLKQTQKYNI